MQVMEYFLIFILAILVAMIQNYAGPKFMASKFGTRFQTNYPLRTVGTAMVIFVAIIIASFLMSLATKETVKLPA